MNVRALVRIIFVAGISVAILGLYFGAHTSDKWTWKSAISILVIAAGCYMTIVSVIYLLAPSETVVEEERTPVPDVTLPLIYGGFIGAISLGAGIVAGAYIGRNAGFITFIFAFIVTNLLFGIPLAIVRSNTPR